MGKKKKKARKEPEESGLTNILEQIRPEFLEEGAKKITQKDVAALADRADEILGHFGGRSALSRFETEGALLLDLIVDYREGRYPWATYWSVAVVAFTLRYVLKPIDIIPDSLPVIGELDDAVVVGLCLEMVARELEQYKAWKSDLEERS